MNPYINLDLSIAFLREMLPHSRHWLTVASVANWDEHLILIYFLAHLHSRSRATDHHHLSSASSSNYEPHRRSSNNRIRVYKMYSLTWMGTLALLTIASIFFLNAPLSTFFVMRPCEEAGDSNRTTVIYTYRSMPSRYRTFWFVKMTSLVSSFSWRFLSLTATRSPQNFQSVVSTGKTLPDFVVISVPSGRLGLR